MTQFDDYNVGNLSENKGGIMTYQAHEDAEGFETVYETDLDALREDGSDHYKTGGVEPIDLYLAGGMLRDKALADIIKYAFRNRRTSGRPFNPSDMAKIEHCAKLALLAAEHEEE